MDVNCLIRLIRLCVCNVQFLFNGTFYRQIDGVAMGSPLGPVLANIFMGHIEQQAAGTIGMNSVFYCRYVDDILLVVEQTEHVEQILAALNNVHPNIKLTCESARKIKYRFLMS